METQAFVSSFDNTTNIGKIDLITTHILFSKLLDIVKKSPRQTRAWDKDNHYWVISGADNYIAIEDKLSKTYEDFKRKTENENVIKYCWKGTLDEWLNTSKEKFLEEMKINYKNTLTAKLHPLEGPPVDIWRAEYENLRDDLKVVNGSLPGFNIIFEYCIPGTSNSRPDVLLVSKDKIIIIEYKNHKNYKDAEDEAIFQTGLYYRELANMHTLSFDSDFYTFVFFGNIKNKLIDQKRGERSNFYFCTPGKLNECILRLIPSNTTIIPFNVDEWINSPYEPRPDIIEAAQRIFSEEDLRDIRIAKSTKIPTALKGLKKGIKEAEKEKGHYIVFVSGVPGAGKTYLGLQLVNDFGNNAMYYSGNGPLVEVLQTKLNNTVTIKRIDSLVNDCLDGTTPYAHIFVFDEGQRAWDESSKYKEPEPEILMRTLASLLDWCFFVILIGDGQAIYKSEPNDLEEWKKALDKRKDIWTVRCPEKYKNSFVRTYDNVQDYLNLDETIRSIGPKRNLLGIMREQVGKLLKIGFKKNAMNQSFDFVSLLLSDSFEKNKIKQEVKALRESCYEIKLTRDLNSAKENVSNKLKNLKEKTYGIIASREDSNISTLQLKQVVRKTRYANRTDITYSQWYDANNIHSCRHLEAYVDELGCQGLELDYTIVCWGSDLRWNNETASWETYNIKNKPLKAIEREYRINSYRVLLTRARYGMTIYVPDKADLDDTFELLQELLVPSDSLLES